MKTSAAVEKSNTMAVKGKSNKGNPKRNKWKVCRLSLRRYEVVTLSTLSDRNSGEEANENEKKAFIKR